MYISHLTCFLDDFNISNELLHFLSPRIFHQTVTANHDHMCTCGDFQTDLQQDIGNMLPSSAFQFKSLYFTRETLHNYA